MHNEELTPEERAVYDQLRQTTPAGQSLEEKTVRRLQREGLLTDKKRFYLSIPAGIAASVMLLATGLLLGKFFFGARGAEEPLFNYMLVLHEDPAFTPGEPEEMFAEYSRWMEQIYERGIAIDGQEMKPASLLLGKEGIETKPQTRVGGYFVLRASSHEEVVEIAKSSPHLKYGGTIEIKEIMIR